MATKRINGSDPTTSAGTAPARAKAKVTRKPRTAADATTTDNALAATPVDVTSAPLAAEAPVTQPAFEEIAQLAYTYWEARGYQGGSPEDDWLRAESEIRGQSAAASA